MAIKTPSILPGEQGWEEYKKNKKKENKEIKKESSGKKRIPEKIGNITLGDKSFRFGLPFNTYKEETKFFIWRYKRKIGEIIVKKNGDEEEIILTFFRIKRMGNFKDLITDSDFQKEWSSKEIELLKTQKDCYLCGKRISKTAKPNIYHYNIFKKKAHILENSEKVAEQVVKGEITLSEGWEMYNDILEEVNRYYMSLREVALICANCAKTKQIN